MSKSVVELIEAFGTMISPEQDINTAEAKQIIESSHSQMEIVENSYLYGLMRSARDGNVKIPVLNIPQLSDERWNELAYQNRLQRRCSA